MNSVDAAVGRIVMLGNEGNDSLNIDGAIARNRIGSIYFDLGAGDDTVSLRRAQVAEGIDITCPAPGSRTAVLEFLNLKAQRVNIALSGSTQTTVNIDATAGVRNSLGNSRIVLGTGSSNVTVKHSDFTYLHLETTDAAESVSIVDALFAGYFDQDNSLEINLVGENDTLTLQNVISKKATLLNGGDGTDQFSDLGGNSLANLTLANFES